MIVVPPAYFNVKSEMLFQIYNRSRTDRKTRKGLKMFRGLEDCRITTGKRYYRTEENRPNLEKLAIDLRTSTSLEETVDNARRLLNALKVDDTIK